MPTSSIPVRSRPLVVCLHASASTSRQWQPLADDLGDAFDVVAPDLLGHGEAPSWHGDPAGVLMADVTRVHAIAAAGVRRIHLVGHSYGGAVALRAAMRQPDRFASITVYEPMIFRALRTLAPGSREPGEVRELGAAIWRDLRAGGITMAARRFVDYWSGQPRYDAMTPGQQQSIARRMNAVGAHFKALWNDPAAPADYAAVHAPLTLMMGTRTRPSARRIVELMRAALPHASFIPLADLGHLGPLTDAEVVARHIGAAIRGHEQRRFAVAPRLAA